MCCCRRDCLVLSLVASALLGVVAAFLQISGIITVGTAFLSVAFGIGVVYLGVLAAAFALRRGAESAGCLCRLLKAVLVGILGTILVSVILLAVGITATSVVSAILVGLLVGALSLVFSASACMVQCLAGCES